MRLPCNTPLHAMQQCRKIVDSRPDPFGSFLHISHSDRIFHVRTIMRHSLPRISTAAIFSIAALAASLLGACQTANQLLYTNKEMQSIQRDTLLSSGQIKTEIQTPPENAAPGVIKLAQIE